MKPLTYRVHGGSPGWPTLVLERQGVPDMPPFEPSRVESLAPHEDAFSWNSSSSPNVLSDFAEGAVPAPLCREMPVWPRDRARV